MTRIALAIALLITMPVAAATAGGSAGIPEDRLRFDRLMVKLSRQAADSADELPEDTLPRGIPSFDTFKLRSGIRCGYRVVRTHGLPVGDPELFRSSGLDRWYTLLIDDPGRERLEALYRALLDEPWVERVELVTRDRLHAIPNDPHFNLQWQHHNTGQTGGTADADMDSPEGWDLGTGAPSGVIAFLDSGVETTHEDLIGNLAPGYDFVHDDDVPEEEFNHGTYTSGLAAARTDNAIGVAGLCWNCLVMQLKIADADGNIDTEVYPDAIRWGADNGADVIGSMSAGAYRSQAMSDAVQYAMGRGTLVMCANGNMNAPQALALPTVPGVMAVGGTDEDDLRFLSYGDHLEISAPGINCYTTAPGNGYDIFGGTCASVALTSAVAGLLRAEDGDLHVNELRYLLRLGADDQVGDPSEDTPGWDIYMGWGRANAHGSLSLIDGPWLALDRPHYLCAGEITVALKDKTAGASVGVTLTGDTGGDSETVTVLPVTAHGYYEGDIPISWAGRDGPVVVQDGTLDLVDGETVTAAAGPLTASAFMDCVKDVCFLPKYRRRVAGDCDGDGAADPGELWEIGLALHSDHTSGLPGATATMVTNNPDIDLVDGDVYYGTLHYGVKYPEDSDDGVGGRLRVRAGAPVNGAASFNVVAVSGTGWENDPIACRFEAGMQVFSLPINRDLGGAVQSWDFDDATVQGFASDVAHGTGDLSECDIPPPWFNGWGATPADDRAHSGTYAMRLGDGTSYLAGEDAGLVSPLFDVPAGGGAVAFYSWIDSEMDGVQEYGVDGFVVESKAASETDWTYMEDGTYTSDQVQDHCGTSFQVPFGWDETVDMYAGDGDGTDATGDSFDRQHQVSLSPLAGTSAQVRFRFGSNALDDNLGAGLWIDSVTIHPWVADGWPGAAPANLIGSEENCPASYDLAWDAVAGTEGYAVYRSELSCDDAAGRTDVYGTSMTPAYSDGAIIEGVEYFYAVEALEAGPGCPTERSCIAGGCTCIRPGDPMGLLIEKAGGDLLLTWDDPGLTGITWNVYRDENPDPATWGGPQTSGIADEDPGRDGVQHTDSGAMSAGPLLHYLVTAVNECGESLLR
jgi:hypothetical protein